MQTMTPKTARARARYRVGLPEWHTDGYGPHTAQIEDCTLWVDLAMDQGYAVALLWCSDYGDGTDLYEQELSLRFDTLADAKRAAVATAVAAVADQIRADDEIQRLIESEYA